MFSLKMADDTVVGMVDDRAVIIVGRAGNRWRVDMSQCLPTDILKAAEIVRVQAAVMDAVAQRIAAVPPGDVQPGRPPRGE